MKWTCSTLIGFCVLIAALLLADSAAGRPLGEERLGTEWSMTEGGITGHWVRRGNSETWDGTWANGAVAILTISITDDKVRISRKDVSGPSAGLTAIYEGTLASDGTLQGTETVTSPFQMSQKWQGSVVKGFLGEKRLGTEQNQSNLALKKPASQSSTWGDAYAAAACVDGIQGSVCATQLDTNPWWQVDLQGNYALSEIVVNNRTDCCSERSRTLTALLSSDGKNWSRIYAHDGSDFKVLRINAGGRTARYVRLQLASTDYMNLNEVEVYGVGSPNPPTPPQPTSAAVRYRVENLIYNMPDVYTNPRNLHDFVVDFTNCTIRNLSKQSDEGRVSIKVLVCRDKRRLTFTVSGDSGTVEYDWVFRENGKIVAGVWRQGTGFGLSVGAIFDMNSGWDVR